MNTLKTKQGQPAPIAYELCQRFGVQCRVVGHLFTAEELGQPVAHEDLTKWMVTAPAGAFPAALVRAIPLAETAGESHALAMKYLMLAERATGLGNYSSIASRADSPSVPIPTPVYLAFIHDETYWPNDDTQAVYASGLVIEVDGNRYEQHDIEPDTFKDTTSVVIIEGDVFDEMSPLHLVRHHFESWISGHRPVRTDGEVA